jgi:hypothetical protein
MVSVANSAGKRWLALVIINGTGCSLSYTDWYELKNNKLGWSSPYLRAVSSMRTTRFETRFLRGSQSGAEKRSKSFIMSI